MSYTFPLVWDLLGWAIPLLISLCIPVVAVVKLVDSYATTTLSKARSTESALNLNPRDAVLTVARVLFVSVSVISRCCVKSVGKIELVFGIDTSVNLSQTAT